MDLPDSDRGDFSCRRAVDSSSYWCIHNHVKTHGNGCIFHPLYHRVGYLKDYLNHSLWKDMIGKLHPVSKVYFVIRVLLTMKMPSEQH